MTPEKGLKLAMALAAFGVVLSVAGLIISVLQRSGAFR
jgi:hypothetical protein